MWDVRFTTSARKHRIGKARALQAMAAAGDPADRGVELEVIAVQQPDYLLVIHVMPYAYRRSSDA